MFTRTWEERRGRSLVGAGGFSVVDIWDPGKENSRDGLGLCKVFMFHAILHLKTNYVQWLSQFTLLPAN